MKYYLKFLIPFTFKPGCEESNFLSVRDKGKYPMPIETTFNNKNFKIWLDENNHSSIIHTESSPLAKEFGVYNSINLSIELDAESDFYNYETHPTLKEIVDESSLIFNKFIKYFKIRKKQYWLDYSTSKNNNDFFNLWECKISTDNTNWQNLRINTPIALSFKMVDNEVYYDNSDTPLIKEFIEGAGRLPFEDEVLANTNYLMDIKQNKAAAVELYIYFEAFIYRFVRNINKEKVSHIQNTNLDELPKYIERLGVSGFISYLLPLILTDVSKEQFEKVYKFITLRQNIIHTQKKDVDEKDLIEYYKIIKEVTLKMKELLK